MEQLALKCENLHKKIGKKEILKGVSLQVEKGDILGFIGPNGAGKTTTIKLILGLQSITEGVVEINGYNVKKDFTKAIESVGAIVENPDLYMYLSGYENLKLISNLYKNVDEKRIQEVIRLVGLENRMNDKVSKYSLGMRQRLGVAQAILHRPKLLILDEPTNGLDPEGIKAMRELLIHLAQEEGMGVLISSHNLAELESFCNKVCIIKNGEIIETANIEEAKKVENNNHYEFEVEDTSLVKDLFNLPIEVKNNKVFTITISKEEVPKMIETLVKNKIKVYEVKEEKLTLEDAFLKKTGGNQIV